MRNPTAWWQHAGHAARQECRLVSRRQAPLHSLEQRRSRRLRHQVWGARIWF
jgi:hypothetical protein